MIEGTRRASKAAHSSGGDEGLLGDGPIVCQCVCCLLKMEFFLLTYTHIRKQGMQRTYTVTEMPVFFSFFEPQRVM